MFGDFEEDPAADFLERERKELAGLEDDPAADFLERERNDLASMENDETWNNLQTEDANPGYLNDFEVVDGKSNGYAILSPPEPQPPQPAVFVEEPECEKVRQWREDFAKRLERKDEEEIEANERLKAEARDRLEEWMKRQEEQFSQRRTANRDAESAMIAEREETAPGAEWERVCRLCDFKAAPKAVGTSGNTLDGRRDVSRMRGLLLQLKQSPPVHFAQRA